MATDSANGISEKSRNRLFIEKDSLDEDRCHLAAVSLEEEQGRRIEGANGRMRHVLSESEREGQLWFAGQRLHSAGGTSPHCAAPHFRLVVTFELKPNFSRHHLRVCWSKPFFFLLHSYFWTVK